MKLSNPVIALFSTLSVASLASGDTPPSTNAPPNTSDSNLAPAQDKSPTFSVVSVYRSDVYPLPPKVAKIQADDGDEFVLITLKYTSGGLGLLDAALTLSDGSSHDASILVRADDQEKETFVFSLKKGMKLSTFKTKLGIIDLSQLKETKPDI